MKHDDNYVQNILDQYGAILIEYRNTKNVICKDQFGYKYKATLGNLKSRNGLPSVFRGNPFAVDNLHIYLRLHGSPLRLLSTEIKTCKDNLEFICDLHADKGIQLKTLDYVVNSNCGCKYCNLEKRFADRRIDSKIVSARCEELGLNFERCYPKDGSTWVAYTCPKHIDVGIQHIEWSHLKICAKGCSYCAGKHITTDSFRLDIEENLPTIDIIGEYKGSEEKILCKCLKCGHTWAPIARSLRNGQGCPHCKTSKGERKISDYLHEKGIEYVSQKTFNGCRAMRALKFDFFIPKLNLAIEYDGEQHYRPVDFASKGAEWASSQYKKFQLYDKIKDDFCVNNGIRLLRIPYWNREKIEEILDKEIQ